MLEDTGDCQFCGAKTERGIHECLEIFNLGFQEVDFTEPENHLYRFLIVDANTLQHSEIHGRWNNHFHLSRLHLIFEYKINWTYPLSPKLSNFLNAYKTDRSDEYLDPPDRLKRGEITTTDVLKKAIDPTSSKAIILKWAEEVYGAWHKHHTTVDHIAKEFIKQRGEILAHQSK